MIRALLFSLSLALSVLAYTVTSPTNTTQVIAGKSLQVEWTKVNTDTNTIDVILVNNAIFPTVSQPLASNVDGTTGSLAVQVPDVSGSGYQINLQGVNGQGGILAQSNDFTITAGSSSTSGSSTSSGSSSTTSSSSASGSTSASSSGFSTSGSSTSASGSSTSSSASASPSNNAAVHMSAQNGLVAISLLIGALMA